MQEVRDVGDTLLVLPDTHLRQLFKAALGAEELEAGLTDVGRVADARISLIRITPPSASSNRAEALEMSLSGGSLSGRTSHWRGRARRGNSANGVGVERPEDPYGMGWVKHRRIARRGLPILAAAVLIGGVET